jgi:hypothetical protein
MLMIDDPLSLLMQGIWLLAAGMYPLGFMFGTCSACCNQCRNDTCEGFDLEEAFSCRSAGTAYCPEFTQGPDLLSLLFSATCFGSGAAGEIEGRGADVGAGPLVSASVTEGGSGYARLGRQAPTLSIGNFNTTPADVTISFSQTQGECDLDFWSVDSITVNNGGEGYTDGDALTLTAAEGSTVVAGATGTISTLRVQPTITASTASGTGATFTVSITAEDVAPDPLTWKITGVTFSGTTLGFVDGEAVTFSGDNLVELATATATVVTKRVEPTLSATIPFSLGNGSGAVLAVTLASNNDDPETWSVDAVQITSAGTGYEEFDVVEFSVVSGTEGSFASAYVSQVDANGEILAIFINIGGSYYELSDELDFIQLDDGGLFYRDNGTIASIAITNGGSYYEENADLAPYVEVPTVTIRQLSPSAGTGGQITAVVDDDTSSPTFGEVVSVTLDNAGDGYLAWDFVSDFQYLGDGQFAFGTAYADPQPGFPGEVTFGGENGAGVPTKGCWVSGDGIAFGTRVTDLSREILDYGEPAPPKGCCDISYDTTATGSFGFCGSVQQRTEKVIRTEQECNDREAAIAAEQCFSSGGFGGVGSMVNSTSNLSKAWTECTDCNGDPIGSREMIIDRTYSGRWIVTVSPAPEETPPGCVSFCGGSGLCGAPRRPDRDENAAGPFGADVGSGLFARRMCLRWICRCYEGTGKKNQTDPDTGDPLFVGPYDWYEVASTTEVGGPVVFGGSLTEKLEAATSNFYGYEQYEHDVVFGLKEWAAEDGDILCVIWRFAFYGDSFGGVEDRCRFPNDESLPGTVTPLDIYTIAHCDRCSCQ